MRIGTISFTDVDNYGAVLQAYALSKVLEREGHEVNILDYQLPDLKLRDWLHLMHLSYTPHAPLTVATGVSGLPARFKRIEHFRKQHLDRTPPVWNDDDLRKMSAPYDALITGSDEIFRTDRQGNLFPPLFLNFADAQRQKLAAYAACSGGVTDYGGKNAVVARLLNRFDHISVRDAETQALVKKLTGRNPPLVVDPTLLWKFEELPLPAPPAKDYLLVYGFFRSPRTDRMVREIADQLGVSMVSVGWASKYAHHNLMAADTLQWLSCFKHARLVFTNCYHGLMFATAYQRDFLVFEADKVRTKLNDFIQRYSLSSRLLATGERPSPGQLAGMDHAALQNQLQASVADSIEFLRAVGQPREKQKPATEDEAGLVSWKINRSIVPVRPAEAQHQLKNATIHLVHLVWEAIMSPLTCPPLLSQARQRWQTTAAGILLFAAVVWLHIGSNAHLLFLPLYLLPCIWLSVKVNPRLGVAASLAAAISGALVQHFNNPDFRSWVLVAANMVMRFVSIHVIVSLVERLYRPKNSGVQYQPCGHDSLSTGLFHHWVVILTGFILYAGVVSLQLYASPHLMLLPLYMIPCLMIALVVGWRWGSILAILGAVTGPLVQMSKDSDYNSPSVMIWNMTMRLIVLLALVLLPNIIHFKKRIN